MGHSVKGITINAVNNSIACAANTSSVLSNYIQYRLDLARRAGDDAHDFTRRSLLLQRLFQLVEQPHVRDRDNCLVGKGFQEFDLRRGEWTYLGATCVQSSNKLPLLTEGSSQEGAHDAEGAHLWEIVLRAGVGNVKRAILAHPFMLWLIKTDLNAADAYETNRSP